MDAQGYLKIAQDCLAQAAIASDLQGRLHWLAMSEKWLKLAHLVQVWKEDEKKVPAQKTDK